MHSGVSTKPAPPAAASRTSASVTGRLAAGSSVTDQLHQAGAHRLARQHRVKLAGVVQRVEVVAAADMAAADEDLRHGAAAHRRAASSRRAGRGRALTSISVKATPFWVSSRLAAMAIGAERGGVDFDGLHGQSSAVGCDYRDLGILRNARQHQNGNRACARRKAGLGRGGQAWRPRSSRHRPAAPGGPRCRAARRGWTRERAGQVGKALVAVAALLAAGVAAARCSRSGQWSSPASRASAPRQQRRLVVAPLEQPQPVQRHRRHQHARAAGSAPRRAPSSRAAGRARSSRSPCFQRQHHAGGRCPCRAAPRGPRSQGRAMVRQSSQYSALALVLARQGRAAAVADQPGDEGRVAPAGAAQAEIAVPPASPQARHCGG